MSATIPAHSDPKFGSNIAPMMTNTTISPLTRRSGSESIRTSVSAEARDPVAAPAGDTRGTVGDASVGTSACVACSRCLRAASVESCS